MNVIQVVDTPPKKQILQGMGGWETNFANKNTRAQHCDTTSGVETFYPNTIRVFTLKHYSTLIYNKQRSIL